MRYKKLFCSLLGALGALSVQAQSVNFDAAGITGTGQPNYSGQGVYSDLGNNFWNPITFNGTTAPGYYSDGVTRTAITFTDNVGNNPYHGWAGTAGTQGTPGGLEGLFLYCANWQTISNTLNNVPPNNYNLYIYSQSGAPNFYGRKGWWQVWVSGTSYYDCQYVTNSTGYSSSFVEGNDYLLFTNLVVGGNGATITMAYAPDGYEIDFDGVQLVPTLPVGPSGLTATPGDTRVRLAWNAAPNATSYNIKRSTTSGGEVTIANVTSGTTYIDSGLSDGTTYYYTVTAVTSGGETASSIETTATPMQALQVVNFDVPGGVAGGVNYVGQGVYPDAQASTYWNAFSFNGTTATGKCSDGVTPSTITLTDNLLGNANNSKAGTAGGAQGTLAALESPYAVVQNYNKVYETLNHVPAGNYDLYFYGINDTNSDFSAVPAHFLVYVGTTYYGSQALVGAPITSSFMRGNNYVVFNNVAVGAEGVITFLYNGAFNGLQLIRKPAVMPAPVTGVLATGGNGQVALHWDTSPGAASYNVKRSTSSGAEVIVANVTAPSYSDTGLANDTTYYYQVSAVSAAGETSNSLEVGTTPSLAYKVMNFDVIGGISGAPNYSGQGAVADAGNNYWNAWVYGGTTAAGKYSDGSASPITLSDNTAGNSAANYFPTAIYSLGPNGTVMAFQDPFVVSVNSTATSLTLNNVPAGAYDLYLYGDNGGNHNRGTTFTVTVGGAASQTLSTLNTAEHAWMTQGNDYVVFTNLGFAQAGSITFTFQDNPNGSQGSWEGDFNGLQLVGRPPVKASVPASLSVTTGNGQALLTWASSAGATGYNVKRSSAPGQEVTIATVTGATYLDQGLIQGVAYYYEVTAVNYAGESAASSEVGITARKALAVINFEVPGYWTGTAYSGQGGYLDMPNSFWNSITFDGVASGCVCSDGSTPTTVTFTHNVAGMPDTTNMFDGGVGTPGAPSGLQTPYDLVTAPFAVTNTLNNVPAGTYDLYLYGKNGAKANGSTAFTVAVGGSSYGTQSTANGSDNAFTQGNDYVVFRGLTVAAGGTITFSYQANGSAGEGDFNGAQLVAQQPLAAPSGLSATPNNGQINLTWTAGAGAASYNIKRSTISGEETIITNVTGTSYLDTGLTNGTTYYYVVSAVNSSGETPNSVQVSVIPGVIFVDFNTGLSTTLNRDPIPSGYQPIAGVTMSCIGGALLSEGGDHTAGGTPGGNNYVVWQSAPPSPQVYTFSTPVSIPSVWLSTDVGTGTPDTVSAYADVAGTVLLTNITVSTTTHPEWWGFTWSQCTGLAALGPNIMCVKFGSQGGADNCLVDDMTVLTPPAALKAVSLTGASARNGQFMFQFNGTDGHSYVVETCTNLANPAWTPVYTNTQSGGMFIYTNTSMSKGARFYRVKE